MAKASDDAWYRAGVMSVTEEGFFKLFFPDFAFEVNYSGDSNSECVPFSNGFGFRMVRIQAPTVHSSIATPKLGRFLQINAIALKCVKNY